MTGPGKRILFWLILLVVVPLLVLLVLEAVFSISYYQRNRRPELPKSSTAAAVRSIWSKFRPAMDTSDSDKFEYIVNQRAKGKMSYPSYIYEPQLHHPSDPYHLANPAKSSIVYCNEAGFFAEWTSDEIGFRNPPNQLGTAVDFTFLGDSFTEGACQNENETMAGYFRGSGKKVFNLGRGGSGPLYQLATLREYGSAVKSGKVVWFVFTGNDMSNLREEKTTMLSRYMDPVFTQNLLEKREHVSKSLETFIDSEIERGVIRKKKGIRFPTPNGYGETLDSLEAVDKESALLQEVAGRIRDCCLRQGAELHIVILNHVVYDYAVQDITSKAIRDFADKNGIPCMEFKRDELIGHKEWYTGIGTHFNALGYKTVAERVLKWISE
jgi:lysophospholipase L1-like esterase